MNNTLSVHSTAWWRPAPTPTSVGVQPRAARVGTANVVAFRALVAFTAILLLSPQAWFPVLGELRIAFVAAATAIGAYLIDRLVRQGDIPRFNAEVGIAVMLVAWAVITLPVSYWIGGSVEVLTNQ